MGEERPVSKLETTLAQAFKLRGRSRLNRTEITFVLAYELKWFTPEESRDVLDAALRRGLLKEEGGKLAPVFNVKNVEVPEGFKPDMGVLADESLMDRIIDLLGTAGIGREAALAMVGDKRAEYGDLVTPEVAALVVAKEKKLDIAALIDEAYRRLLSP